MPHRCRPGRESQEGPRRARGALAAEGQEPRPEAVIQGRQTVPALPNNKFLTFVSEIFQISLERPRTSKTTTFGRLQKKQLVVRM